MRICLLQSKLQPIKESSQFKDFNVNMRKNLEKVDRDTQRKKVKKYNRDSNDFKSNNMYLWQNANAAINEKNENIREKETGTENAPQRNNQDKSNGEKNQTTRGRNNTPRGNHNNRTQEYRGNYHEVD